MYPEQSGLNFQYILSADSTRQCNFLPQNKFKQAQT